MKPTYQNFIQRLKSLSTRSILLIASSMVVVIAIIAALSGTISSASKRMEKKLYGEEIGNNRLRYKYGDHIYNPKTGKILVDSIDWLHINYSDTIAILAKNNRRAFINLNTAELITPLIYEKAWEFSCDRGIMVKSDTIYIFRRDGSIVNPAGFKYKGQYDLLYHRDKLIVNVDNDKVGLIDTAAQWVLPPVYSMIENEYQQRMYNTRLGDQLSITMLWILSFMAVTSLSMSIGRRGSSPPSTAVYSISFPTRANSSTRSSTSPSPNFPTTRGARMRMATRFGRKPTAMSIPTTMARRGSWTSATAS